MTNETTNDAHVTPAQLTDTSPVTWDRIPICEVVKLTAGTVKTTELSVLHQTHGRMAGRALGRICGDISVQIHCPPRYSCVTAVGLYPANAGNSSTPSDLPQLLACGGTVIHSNPIRGAGSGSPTFLPGVSRFIKGDTTTTLIGKPPALALLANAAEWTDGTAAAATTPIYAVIRYDLELSGVDWLKPW